MSDWRTAEMLPAFFLFVGLWDRGQTPVPSLKISDLRVCSLVLVDWDRGQALVPTLKINKLQASSLASVYGRGIVA